MVTIYIENRPYEIREGQNLLHACLSLGFDIPYFCWHPAMHSVGACRQCAVKQFRDDRDTKGKIIMSCMTPATEGIRISIDDPEVRAFRASVIEWLMVNHPHDCPVCDEGGECHLQDMTVMTGHVYRRFRFKKRTYRNQYLGPFLNHEMNRCIQCYRCVRFYQDYAGGRDLNVFASHDHVYFGRYENGTLENEFSGNLIEICPTGVFTDKTLKNHYTRKWDLQTAPSVCVHCGLGCNTIPGERQGRLRRILNRFHYDINGYFLCDRGRFGYGFVNGPERIRRPLSKGQDAASPAEPIDKTSALKKVTDLFRSGAGVIGIGSPRASLEANFLLRMLVGPEHFYCGTSERDFLLISAIIKIMADGPVRTPTLKEIEGADAVFVLGEDITSTAPRMALALRQSVRNQPIASIESLRIPLWQDAAVQTALQNRKGPLFIAAPGRTGLDDIALETYRAAPDDIARLGYAVAHEVDREAPDAPDVPSEMRAMAGRIADALRHAKHPLVIAGTACGSEAIIHAAAQVSWALSKKGHPAGLSFTVPECDSIGLGLLGGRSIKGAFKAAQGQGAEAVIILENDLYRRSDSATVDKFFDGLKHVIAVDHLSNPTTQRADVVLPAATFAEADGTMVNNEGRAQRSFRVFAPDGDIRESWRWLRDMLVASGRSGAGEFGNFEAVLEALAEMVPVFRPIRGVAPPAEFRLSGLKVARQPHRYSGRTAMTADISVDEPKTPDDPDSPLSFSMEGYEGRPPASLIPRYWTPGWNSVQSLNKFQIEIGGPLLGGDPGLRLIDENKFKGISYFDDIPHPFRRREEELLIVPLYHVFGSEELSMASPDLAERASRPHLALNPEDAERVAVKDGEVVGLALPGGVYKIPVNVRSDLPAGVGALPAGLPGLQGIDLPAWGRVSKSEK